LIGAVGGYYVSSPRLEGVLQEASLAGSGEESRLERILSQVLETQVSGTRVAWQNGGSGAIVPVRTFQTRSGQYCREFQVTRLAQAAPVSEGGIACRQSDGVWKIRLLYFPE
jgi:surface antigen